MKKLFLLLLLMVGLQAEAWATTVTIQQVVLTGWNGPTTVELRIVSDTTFTDSLGALIPQGNISEGRFYRTFTCTVVGGNLTIAEGTLPSTTDGRDIQTARWSAYFVNTSTGQIIQAYRTQFSVPPSPVTTTWADLFEFNSLGAPIPIDRDTYSKTQVNRLFEELRESLMTNGVVNPPAGGTGLSVTNENGFLVALSGTFSLRTIVDADVPDTITVSNYQLLSQKGQANGYAALDGSSLLSVSNVPNLQLLNGLLDDDSGGTGFASHPLGTLLIGDASNNLVQLAPNATATKLFLTMASSVASYAAIARADLPAGLSATPTANAILLGNGTTYDVTTTPTIASLTTTAVAALTLNANATVAAEIRFLDANGDAQYTGFRAPNNRASSLIITLPEGSPTAGQTLVFGNPAGGFVTTSYGSPAVPATGITEVSVDGSAIADGNTSLDFLGATSGGVIGGVGPFVGDSDGGVDRIAIRTSPDNSTILVGTGRTISGDATITGGGDLSANRTLSVVADTTNQQVQVKDNAGSVIGTRRSIRFDNTPTLEFSLVDNGSDTVTITGEVMTTSDTHELLSATHTDTVAKSLMAGDRGGVIRVNSDPAYELLVPTTANRALYWNGTDTVFGQIDLSTSIVTGILPTTSGSFGVSIAGVTDGQIPIGHDANNNFSFATITAGAGISVVNAAGSITIAATGSVGVTATDDDEVFDLGTPTKINLVRNPGTTSSGAAQAFAVYPDLHVGAPVAVATIVGTATRGDINGYRIYVERPLAFNTISVRVITAGSVPSGVVQQPTASIGVWSADGSTKLVDSGAILVTSPAAVKTSTSLTGANVSGGIATLLPGNYLLVFANTRGRGATGTLGVIPSYTGYNFATSSSHAEFLNSGGAPIHLDGGSTDTGLQPATLSLTSTGTASQPAPFVKFSRQ